MATANFWTYLLRGESGEPELCQDFDMKVYRTAKKLAKKYAIKFNPNELVVQDDALIERAFQAGFEMLVTMGIFNIDSGKVIRFTENEILQSIARQKSAITLGYGKDAFEIHNRKIEDKRLPVVAGGCGNQVDEEYRYLLYLGYAKNPWIDYIEPVPPYKFMGHLVKAGTPFEIQACLNNIALYRKACLDAGRPGMPIKGKDGVSAIADIATNREDIGYRKTDHNNVYFKPSLKTTYEDLNRVTQYVQYGTYVSTGGCAYIGGYCGDVEGAVICSIAESLAGPMLYNAVINHNCVMESVNPSASTRKSLWGTNLASAAINRYTNLPAIWGAYLTMAGPCTEMMMYEIAAQTISTTMAGCNPFGVAPNQGVTPNYCTPMECQFMGEVAYATTQIDRKTAGELVEKLVQKYEKALETKDFPKGKTFAELYDLETVEPKQEYIELHDRIWAELEEMGLPQYKPTLQSYR